VGSAAIGASGGKVGRTQVELLHPLEEMDKAGVATALTSISAPGLSLPGEASRDRQRIQRLARQCNEFAKRWPWTTSADLGPCNLLCPTSTPASPK